jgi:DUF3102 family protein
MSNEQLSLNSIGKEVSRLHREIHAAASAVLTKAIRVGELLYDAKARVQHGGWATWLRENVDFTDRTARNYLACYERRGELKRSKITSLSDAYRMLCLPMGGKRAIREITKQTAEAVTTSTQIVTTDLPNNETETMQQPKQKRWRNWQREISPAAIDLETGRQQFKIDRALALTVKEIEGHNRVLLPDFADRLILHGNALIQQGQRLKNERSTTD